MIFTAAYAFNGLANCFQRQGRYREAEPPYLQALHIREQQLGSDHPETATTLHDLATFQNQQGHYQEALVIRDQALVVI